MTPQLYRHVTILDEFFEDKNSPKRTYNRKLRRLPLLLIQRPDLARLVRYVDMRVKPSPKASERSKEIDMPAVYINPVPEFVKIHQASSTIAILGGESGDGWLERLDLIRDCDPDELLALLLPALLNMEELVLNADSMMFPSLHSLYSQHLRSRAASMEKPFDIQAPFERLRVFECWGVSQCETTVKFMASLLKLPVIRRISANIGNRIDNDKSLEELESHSSPLISLDIRSAGRSNTANLRHILRAPKALKDFHYTVRSSSEIDFGVIRHILSPHENCLESVEFDYDDDCRDLMFEDESPEGPMTSFLSFNAIKIFKIAAVFLLTTDNDSDQQSLTNIFPPSLETLHVADIRKYNGGVLGLMEYLLAQKSSQQMPSLTKLILQERGHHEEVYLDRWGRCSFSKKLDNDFVRRMFCMADAHGVKLEFIDELGHPTVVT
ncbi:hypothetical protein MMC07_003886 [Pseudocyphellaria aurata]|nr:hypothetical protein [Pseudocyphellaria aurata]